MDIFLYTFSLFLGVIIGSFLNVVIYRYNTGRTVRGRSMCLSCGKKLSWHELLPVLSFLFQRGRCKGCRSKISWQYPLVEILTGLLFVLVVHRFNPDVPAILYYLTIVSLCVVITVYDLRHKIIPDGFVYGLSAIALFKPFFITALPASMLGVIADPGTAKLILAWEALLSGTIFFLFFGALWLFSKGTWMGFGDAKLAFAIGAILGFSAGLSALMIAVWVGAAFGLLLIAASKLKLFPGGALFSLKSEVPFAPFMILGFLLVLLFEMHVVFF